MRPKAIYIGADPDYFTRICAESKLLEFSNENNLSSVLKNKGKYEMIIYDSSLGGLDDVKFIVDQLIDKTILFVLTSDNDKLQFVSAGADDVFTPQCSIENIENRFSFIKEHYDALKKKKVESLQSFRIPYWKRAFDICFASLAIVFFSPFFILIAILIRLESKGAVFYAAKRVGQGYRVFNFYKFRSMFVDADANVSALMKENQYEEAGIQIPSPENEHKQNKTFLYSDDEVVAEHHFLRHKRKKQETSFFKVANDPRITKVGRFIRNTSIDELPQLFNILIGDMSVVGNRPLPLYEAEMLTTDQWAKRFLAPAGLTGLWQVTKRGGANKMSADERKQLDIDYAETYNFWLDIKIILKTIPAMLQHENV